MKFYEALVLLSLVVLPFFPKQLDVRIIFGIYLLAAFLLPVFWKTVKTDFVKKDPLTIFFLFFLLAGVVSSLFSIDQKRSFIQLFLFLSYFIIFTSVRSVFGTLESKKRLAGILISATVLLSLISLYNTLLLHSVNREAEGVSFLWVYYGHNHLSALLIFSLPLCFYFVFKRGLKKPYYRYIFLLAFCFLLFSLFFTFGVGSVSSLAFSSLLTLLIFKRNISSQITTHLGIATILIVIAFLLNTLFLARGVGVRKYSSTVTERMKYWQQATNNFLKNPLTGTGLDTFRTVNATSKIKTQTRSYYTFNFFLQMLSDSGIFGFLTSIALIFSVLWQAFKKVGEKLKTKEDFLFLAFWVGLFASTLNSLFDFDWQIPTVFFVFWLIAGLFPNPKASK